MIIVVILFLGILLAFFGGLYWATSSQPPETKPTLYPINMTVTVKEKGITGKNIMWGDIKTIIGTKNEAFHVNDVTYLTIQRGETYNFMCRETTSQAGISCKLIK